MEDRALKSEVCNVYGSGLLACPFILVFVWDGLFFSSLTWGASIASILVHMEVGRIVLAAGENSNLV